MLQLPARKLRHDPIQRGRTQPVATHVLRADCLSDQIAQSEIADPETGVPAAAGPGSTQPHVRQISSSHDPVQAAQGIRSTSCDAGCAAHVPCHMQRHPPSAMHAARRCISSRLLATPTSTTMCTWVRPERRQVAGAALHTGCPPQQRLGGVGRQAVPHAGVLQRRPRACPAAKACKVDAEKRCNVTWFFGHKAGAVIACLRCACRGSHLQLAGSTMGPLGHAAATLCARLIA